VLEAVPFRPHREGGGAVLGYRAIVIEEEPQIQVLVLLRGLLIFSSILCTHRAALALNKEVLTFNAEIWRVVMMADVVDPFGLVIETTTILNQVLCN